MKKILAFTILALVTLTIFTLALAYLPIIEAKPDIILIMVIYIAIASDQASDIFLAFISGYLYDIFSGSAVGLFAMLRTADFVLTRLLNMKFFSRSTLFFVIATFVISMFDSIYLGYQFLTDANGFLPILANALYLSFINAIAGLIIYPLLTKMEELYFKKFKETEGRY